MIDLNVELLEKNNFINKLYIYNLNFVRSYSESLYNSLNIAWKNYTDEKNSCNKRERSIEKLNKNLDKLEIIETKKTNNRNLNEIIESNIQYINKIYNYDLLSLKYRRKVINLIEKVDGIYSILKYAVDTWIVLNKCDGEKKQKNKENIILPKKKSKGEDKISYVIDKNNYLYTNVVLENGIMLFDKKSFEIENKRYKRALNSNMELFEQNEKNVKLSPFEKKRRIYIQTMFELEKNLILLEQKNIDITFPIEKYFEYSRLLIEYLYKDITDFSANKSSILNYLMNETKRTYGCERLLSKYDIIVVNLYKKIEGIDKFVLQELENVSNYSKEIDYKEFNNITELVPSLIDIYKIINKKIIRNIGLFLKEFNNDIKGNIAKVTCNMPSSYVIEFYYEIKNVLYRESVISISKLSSYLIELQQSIVSVLKDKLNTNEDIIFEEYLKEEKIY